MQNKNSLNYERVKSKSKLEQKRKANVKIVWLIKQMNKFIIHYFQEFVNC